MSLPHAPPLLGSQRSLPFSDPGSTQSSGSRVTVQLQPGMMAHSLPAMPGGHMPLDAAAQSAYIGGHMGAPPMAAVQGYPVQIPPGYALVPAMPGVPQLPVPARTLLHALLPAASCASLGTMMARTCLVSRSACCSNRGGHMRSS